MITLTLVRHGESTDNVRALWAGWKDAPLSNHGMNQAQALGLSLASLPIKAIFSSPLKRAHTTAVQIFERQYPRPLFEESALLKEQHWGIAEGHPWTAPSATSLQKKDYYPLLDGPSSKFPEGESRDDVAARASRAINVFIIPHVLAARGEPAEEHNIVIVAHGILIAEMIGELLRRESGRACEAYRFAGLVNTGWARLLLGFEREGPDDDGLQVTTGTVRESSMKEDHMGKVDRLAEPHPTQPAPGESQMSELVVKLVAFNQAPHLAGLKRQGGGIGSSTYDAKQRTLHDFFGDKTQR